MMNIRVDDLSGDKVVALLQEHLDDMHRITPPESVHALDLEALRMPSITFWSVWEGGELLGCGALKELENQVGEIKSMRTARHHRNKGVAARMLQHLIQVANNRQYTCLKLETGVFVEFAPARKLYQRYGFEHCEPFGDYTADPNSVYMSLDLRKL